MPGVWQRKGDSMAKKLRPATQAQRVHLNSAIDHLETARDLLKMADCPGPLKRVRAALKSADGARRHMRNRVMHANP